jgi:GntR family transcriptional regulator/MocR family aminotransferase
MGLPPGPELDNTDIVYTTPSHQLPTTVTMPTDRRKALLAAAKKNDFLIVEDDYELETNYVGQPLPALKSLDQEGRVIYVGSFSKTLFPGLRLGFVVASKAFIDEMRGLRRLMVRHPPTNNQRSTAFFLSLGYYDVFVRRLHRVYRERWETLGAALAEHLPDAAVVQAMGGSSYWVGLNPEEDTQRLSIRAADKGILIEPGNVYFHLARQSSFMRLGFSSIDVDRISDGVKELAKLR